MTDHELELDICVAFNSAVQMAKSVLNATVEPLKMNYTCETAECKKMGGVVVRKSDLAHVHPCPVEVDMCASWRCNSTSVCEA